MLALYWALLALAAYSLVPPLTKLATGGIPSDVVALVSNGVLVLAAGVLAVRQYDVTPYLTHPDAVYMYGAGLCLAVGILAYYRALSLGDVSVVTPVFGMFLVTSSLVGVVFLDESFTARKAAGVGFAILAIYFSTT